MEATREATPVPEAATGGMTRRQLLIGATAGGAALAVTALGGGAVGVATTRAVDDIELTKLRALIALYEQLDKVGIDAVIAAGMGAVRGALGSLQAGTRLVRDGITATENALEALQGMLDTLHGEADRAAQGLDGLMQQFRAAEAVVGSVLGQAAPLTDSIAGFFSALLDKIPFGIGDTVRRAVDALTGLVRAIPATVDDVTGQLVKPLADAFFPTAGTAPVRTTVFDPIVKNLLDPLAKFLSDVDALAASWQRDLTSPVQAALDERQKIRNQIAALRKENKM